MHIFQKLVWSSFVFLLFQPFVACSSPPHEHNQTNSHKFVNQNASKVSHDKKTFDITLHGILLWTSLGFLMPIGILTIRMSREECFRTRLKPLFYIHAIFQVVAVLLATIGAVLSIKNFENSFKNSHQRIGLALYGAIWVQAVIGLRRPKRGNKGRNVWYFSHWILGTAISLAGIFNIYTGLKAYHNKTSKSVTLWTILFTAEVSFIGFFYLFQDKWEYMKKQRQILGIEQSITPSEQVHPQRENSKEKENLSEPCRKSNALGGYFAKSNALRKLFQLT